MISSASQTELAAHSFLYAGEWQNGSFAHQRMFLVQQGRIDWSYELPIDGEFGQVTLLPEGHVLFARYSGASEIDRSGKVRWNFDAPEGAEIHTCQAIGTDHVFLVINDNPARAVLVRKLDNAIVRQLDLRTLTTHPHGMFRHCSYTGAGNVLIAHLDSNTVTEYDWTGAVLWSVHTPTPWAAVRLLNRNTLISGDSEGYVAEYSPGGRAVWTFDRADAEAVGIELYCIQQATRLANGNTIVANWCSEHEPEEVRRRSVQLLEVTPAKEVVWTLSQWHDPDLGPASQFHILGEDLAVDRA